MGLTNKKEEQLKQMPLIRTRITKSKDGKLLFHKTEIIDVKPATYYEAVFADANNVSMETEEDFQPAST